MKKVILQTSTFTVLVGLVIYFVGRIKPEWLYTYQWMLLAYFYLMMIASLWMVERAAIRDVENISKGFFTAMMIRLFVSVMVALLIIYFDRENSTIFAVNFVILYLLYLAFEIYYLVVNLQPRINRGKDLDQDT